MIFIVSSSYFINFFSALLMNHFDFMTVAFQLWSRVKYDEKEINDFALGLDFALRPWGPSLKIPKKKEKINKVASST